MCPSRCLFVIELRPQLLKWTRMCRQASVDSACVRMWLTYVGDNCEVPQVLALCLLERHCCCIFSNSPCRSSNRRDAVPEYGARKVLSARNQSCTYFKPNRFPRFLVVRTSPAKTAEVLLAPGLVANCLFAWVPRRRPVFPMRPMKANPTPNQ